jgi:galactokinase
MYARVVRFSDVVPERMAELRQRIEASDGPPPGVAAKRMQMLVDEDQRTALAILFFETEDEMRKGGEVLDQMDAAETPGTRVSVDLCEVSLEMEAG